MRIFLGFFIIVCILFIACSKSSPTPASNKTINCSVAKTFAADASPVFQTKCALGGCHGSGSSNGPGELITYQEIFNARSDIRNAVITGLMPQGSSLTDEQLSSIVCWIDSGAPNN